MRTIAITTKYRTGSGSRITASAEGFKTSHIGYPHELSGSENIHREAAREFCQKNLLPCADLPGAELKGGGYVFLSGSYETELRSLLGQANEKIRKIRDFLKQGDGFGAHNVAKKALEEANKLNI